MIDMSVNIAGVDLKNPIITASGTFGFGREYGEMYNLSKLGAICVKGITLTERDGNPPPRIAETPMGVLNSVGLQNPGVDYFKSYEMSFLKGKDTRIVVNISGNTVEEYKIIAEKLNEASIDFLEVNVSCPNVKAGGLTFGTSPDLVFQVTEVVKKAAKMPVIVKLSPNVTDITQIALAAADGGADAISLINTIRAMRIDIDSKRPILKNNIGGLSGPAVFPIAVRMVYETAKAVRIPVIGMGGVMTGRDAFEMMLAGAASVGVGTATLSDPFAPVRIASELEDIAVKKGLQSIREATGGVIPH